MKEFKTFLNESDKLKASWIERIQKTGQVDIETGKSKGVMPNTVKAFAKHQNFDWYNYTPGVYTLVKKGEKPRPI